MMKGDEVMGIQYSSYEEALEALQEGKGVRLDSWKFGRYVQLGETSKYGEGGKVLLDEEGLQLPDDFLKEHFEDASDIVIMKSHTPMKELTDSALWSVTRELIFTKYITTLNRINYKVAKFARDTKSFTRGGECQYIIRFNGSYANYLANAEGEIYTETSVGFNDRDRCLEAIELVREELGRLSYYKGLVSSMQLKEVDDLDSTPFTRSELESIYLKAGGKE